MKIIVNEHFIWDYIREIYSKNLELFYINCWGMKNCFKKDFFDINDDEIYFLVGSFYLASFLFDTFHRNFKIIKFKIDDIDSYVIIEAEEIEI